MVRIAIVFQKAFLALEIVYMSWNKEYAVHSATTQRGLSVKNYATGYVFAKDIV